ncbi:MAG: twin-arginine translocation signal domain-containing protein, partial [Acidobacteria bacterium]|nr:twin-arginine translocation signal domain-containing protein [Acidobacteriota bacterium]
MPLNRRRFLHGAGMAAVGVGAGAAAPWSPAAEDSSARKLKVTGCKTLVVDNVPPYWGFKQWLFVQLLTNEGLIG